jgi:hypothetical protein
MEINQNTKKCSKCNKILNLNCFYKNSQQTTGYRSSCVICDKPIRDKWRNENRQRIKIKNEEYRKNNMYKYINYSVKSNKKMRLNNYKKKIEHNLRGLIHRALVGNYKTGKAIELLGCSVEFYKKYLESMFNENMNWNNRGTVWQIDHIIPVSKFDCTDFEESKKAFHYTNTQVLKKEEHKIKTLLDNRVI